MRETSVRLQQRVVLIGEKLILRPHGTTLHGTAILRRFHSENQVLPSAILVQSQPGLQEYRADTI